MIGGKNPLQQAIHDKVVEPRGRGQLMPDSGVARKSAGTSIVQYGLSNPSSAGLLDTLTRTVSWFLTYFNPSGLRSQEIYVDIIARTAQGRVAINNVLLNTDGLSDGGASIQQALDAGRELAVKITYDGGRAMECSPVAVRVVEPPSKAVAAQQSTLPAPGAGAAPMSGSDTTSNSSTINPIPSVGLTPGVAPGLQFYPGPFKLLTPYTTIINQVAATYGIPATLVGALILQESHGDANANVHNNDYDWSYGLMQVTVKTFPEALNYAKNKYPTIEQYCPTAFAMKGNPTASIVIGCGYFYYYAFAQSGKNYLEALRMYNGGAGYRNTKGYAQAVQYGNEVFAKWQIFIQIANAATNALIKNTGEYNKQDHTNSTAMSGQSAFNAA